MNFSLRFALLAGMVVGMAALPVVGAQAQQPSSQGQTSQKSQSAQQQQQTTGQQQTGQQQTGQPTQPGTQAAGQAAAPKMNPAEEKAYENLVSLKPSDPQAIISAGQDFLKKFPKSRYVGAVYVRLARAYEVTGNADKMFAAGEQALKIDPNDVDVLSLMAYSIPRRINQNDLGASQKLSEAEQYAKHALQLLSTMPKPAHLTDEQFATLKNTESAECHSGLGLVYFYQHNIPSMISELEQAVKINPTPDPVDQYLLGFAYEAAGRWNDAVAPLEQCTASASAIAPRCKERLAEVKKHIAAQPKPKPKQ